MVKEIPAQNRHSIDGNGEVGAASPFDARLRLEGERNLGR
jgi:hypothetical protein